MASETSDVDANQELAIIRYALSMRNHIDAYETDFGLAKAIERLDKHLTEGGDLPSPWRHDDF